MKPSIKIIVVIIPITIVLGVIIFFNVSTSKTTVKTTPKSAISSIDLNTTPKVEEAEPQKDIFKFKKVIGWIAAFDYKNGKNSFYNNINKYTEISPVYYDLVNDGVIQSRSVVGDTELIKKSHDNGVKVIPTIINFDENILEKALKKDFKVDHNDYIMNEVSKYNYDGIDIDYESINLTDQEGYINMLTDLSQKLHKAGKILSISVTPKDKDEGYTTLIETRKVQDWNTLSKISDEIRVMAYDYSSVSTPGPISPSWWVDSILRYAEQKQVLDKIVIGLPFYGYAYGKTRYAYTYDEISQLLKDNNLEPKTDPINNENFFTFSKSGEERKMYYNDTINFKEKLNIIDKYSVLGLSFWRLGGENMGFYNLLETQGR